MPEQQVAAGELDVAHRRAAGVDEVVDVSESGFRIEAQETFYVGETILIGEQVSLRVARNGADVVIALDDGPPVNFCKPAVDPLFTSAINVWQGGVLAVVLTGMRHFRH